MELKKSNKEQLQFKTKINESLANALRRYVHEIPVIAIDEVEITKNDSPLYDETIAHRVGLIPIKMNKKVKDGEELKLDVKKEGRVNSGDLQGNLKVVFEEMPITAIKKNQELKLTAITKKGKGKEHAKYSPGLMFYRNVNEIKVSKDCPKEVVNNCSKNVFAFEDGRVKVKNPEECDSCEECILYCKKQGKDNAIEIKPTQELILTVESFGQLEPKEIFSESLKELKKDLSEFSKKLK